MRVDGAVRVVRLGVLEAVAVEPPAAGGLGEEVHGARIVGVVDGVAVRGAGD